MKRVFSLLIILIVFGIMFFTNIGWACYYAIYWQFPGHYGPYPQDKIKVADDFQINRYCPIVAVSWWGGYTSSDSIYITDDFNIQFFDDNNGEPGNLICDLDVGNPLPMQDPWWGYPWAVPKGRPSGKFLTGDWLIPPNYDPSVNFEGIRELAYYFYLDKSSFFVNVNTRYWLSIENTLNPSEGSWIWEASSPGEAKQLKFDQWEPYSDDMAFVLYSPEPCSLLLFVSGLLGIICLSRKHNVGA